LLSEQTTKITMPERLGEYVINQTRLKSSLTPADCSRLRCPVFVCVGERGREKAKKLIVLRKMNDERMGDGQITMET